MPIIYRFLLTSSSKGLRCLISPHKGMRWTVEELGALIDSGTFLDVEALFVRLHFFCFGSGLHSRMSRWNRIWGPSAFGDLVFSSRPGGGT